MLRRALASAPGKVILFGEHFVVYDKPALVSAIELRARVEAAEAAWEGVRLASGGRDNPAVRAAEYLAERVGLRRGLSLRIESEIPASVGLGSSASVSVAAAAATSILGLRRIELELVREAAGEGERLVHYNPSGIDTAIAVYGGGGVYRRSEGLSSERFHLDRILIIDTGKARRTGEMVRRVRVYAEENPGEFRRLLEEMERLAGEALDALRGPDLQKLGALMSRNQEMLRKVGVSSPEIEEAIGLALKAGALGAKLTGGGGGGCVIAVAEEDKLENVARVVSRRFRTLAPRLMAEGVREEEPG